MAFGGPEACGRSTRGRLPGSSYLDLPPKCSQYGILWPTLWQDTIRHNRIVPLQVHSGAQSTSN